MKDGRSFIKLLKLQLAVLFIFLKLLSNIFWCNFFLKIFVLGYSELVLIFFSSFLYYVLLVSLVVFHSFVGPSYVCYFLSRYILRVTVITWKYI